MPLAGWVLTASDVERQLVTSTGIVFCESEPINLTLLLRKTSQKHKREIHASFYFGLSSFGWPWSIFACRIHAAIRLDSGTELQSDDEAPWIFRSLS